MNLQVGFILLPHLGLLQWNHTTKIKKKSRAHKAGKKTPGCPEKYLKFKELRKEIRCRIRKAMIQFEGKLEDRLQRQPKEFWNNVSGKRKWINDGKILKYEGQRCITGQDIATAFANYFATVYHVRRTSHHQFSPFLPSLCNIRILE